MLIPEPLTAASGLPSPATPLRPHRGASLWLRPLTYSSPRRPPALHPARHPNPRSPRPAPSPGDAPPLSPGTFCLRHSHHLWPRAERPLSPGTSPRAPPHLRRRAAHGLRDALPELGRRAGLTEPLGELADFGHGRLRGLLPGRRFASPASRGRAGGRDPSQAARGGAPRGPGQARRGAPRRRGERAGNGGSGRGHRQPDSSVQPLSRSWAREAGGGAGAKRHLPELSASRDRRLFPSPPSPPPGAWAPQPSRSTGSPWSRLLRSSAQP